MHHQNPGRNTYSKPSWLKFVIIELVGGGGGGSAATSSY